MKNPKIFINGLFVSGKLPIGEAFKYFSKMV